MDRIIHCKVSSGCRLELAFEMFTQMSQVENWLAKKAEIEPVVGGKYELFWDLDNRHINSTIGCRITAIKENHLLAFEWKGAA